MKFIKMLNTEKSFVEFNVHGPVVGKQRPKFTSRDGKTIAYTPKATVEYEKLVRLAARSAMLERQNQLCHGPMSITLLIGIAIPKSFSKKKREEALAGEIYPTVTPDIDNIAKSVLDGCNSVVWHDDKQVVSMCVQKFYSFDEKVFVSVKEI